MVRDGGDVEDEEGRLPGLHPHTFSLPSGLHRRPPSALSGNPTSAHSTPPTASTTRTRRLGQRLELLDGYGRVMNMIEIEVEMDSELPQAEVEGIELQIVQLAELEGLQDDWKAQAEARDEVGGAGGGAGRGVGQAGGGGRAGGNGARQG